MFLKRLELQGFKSFADKTHFEFDAGVVAIVGPNGSGKSNVADGIRWLLGERDARNLRGGKIEDLIFAGTEKRPRSGLAQASLYFDNNSGFFPVPYKEVSISRRVSRDGTSQFFLNKAEVRLKDVIDFFARARVGARGLTIIGQGDSDVFIKATPIERRVLIEEMLGLKEYQIKKSSAKRKLQNTTFNLDKTKALIEELLPRLRLLRRQAKRYEQKNEIEKELNNYEMMVYGGKLKQLRIQLLSITPRLKEVDDKIHVQQKHVVGAENALEEVKKSRPKAHEKEGVLAEEKRRLLEKRAILQRDLGRIETEIEFTRTHSSVGQKEVDFVRLIKEVQHIAQLLQNEEDVTKLREGIKKIIVAADSAFEKTPIQKKDNPELLDKLQAVISALNKVDTEFECIQNEEKTCSSYLEQFNHNFQKAFIVLEDERRKLAIFHEGRNKVVFDDERVRERLRDLERQISEIGKTFHDFENWEGEVTESGEEEMRKIYRLRAELVSIEEIDPAVISEAKEVEERYEFLTKNIFDLEQAVCDLKKLIKELDRKICTEFTHAISTINKEFEKFITLMFGGGKAGLIVQDVPQNIGEESTEEVEGDMTEKQGGIEVFIHLPRKRIKGLEVLSGGERSLVSIAALFALISVSPPPFLVLDEVDAALDEQNARRLGEILKEFSRKTQFVIITHNRATMEAAETLYGVTMADDGASKIFSLKLKDAANEH
ncbi:MAG: AAA family ATPase [bacterium]